MRVRLIYAVSHTDLSGKVIVIGYLITQHIQEKAFLASLSYTVGGYALGLLQLCFVFRRNHLLGLSCMITIGGSKSHGWQHIVTYNAVFMSWNRCLEAGKTLSAIGESWSNLITSKACINLVQVWFVSNLQKGKGKVRQLDLERALTARDRVGIQDMVLLDALNSETAFLDNLKKRFSEDLIYVSLGWPENRVHLESRLFLSLRSLTVTTDHELGNLGWIKSLMYCFFFKCVVLSWFMASPHFILSF